MHVPDVRLVLEPVGLETPEEGVYVLEEGVEARLRWKVDR